MGAWSPRTKKNKFNRVAGEKKVFPRETIRRRRVGERENGGAVREVEIQGSPRSPLGGGTTLNKANHRETERGERKKECERKGKGKNLTVANSECFFCEREEKAARREGGTPQT